MIRLAAYAYRRTVISALLALGLTIFREGGAAGMMGVSALVLGAGLLAFDTLNK